MIWRTKTCVPIAGAIHVPVPWMMIRMKKSAAIWQHSIALAYVVKSPLS